MTDSSLGSRFLTVDLPGAYEPPFRADGSRESGATGGPIRETMT
jgi:hypothetical protein